MPALDIFNNNRFSMMSLTGAVDKIDYVPSFLGSQNLFEVRPVNSETVFIDRRARSVALISTTPRGAPTPQAAKETRDMVGLTTPRVIKGDFITAAEVANIRAFNRENDVEVLTTEVARRMGNLRVDHELTMEYHRLGAIQGILLDADGTTVIQNYFDLMGVTAPSAINFALTTAATDVRGKCTALVRGMARSAKGAFTPATTVHSLTGDTFFDQLINHPTVRETYIQQEGAALRAGVAFSSFTFGGITWHNYQGTDDNSTVAVPEGEARFYPVNARGVFQQALSPADEFVAYAGQMGRSIYAMQYADHHDPQVQRGRHLDVGNYPLHICARPEVLRSGVAS